MRDYQRRWVWDEERIRSLIAKVSGGFDKHWHGDQHAGVREKFRTFTRQVLENFKYYRVPVITLDRSTSKEAVCIVFEKVNTRGKAHFRTLAVGKNPARYIVATKFDDLTASTET